MKRPQYGDLSDWQYSSSRESAAARWLRLAPSRCQSTPVVPAMANPLTTTSVQQARGGRAIALQPSGGLVTTFTPRHDVPTVRYSRRGTTAEALHSLRSNGAKTLVAALVKDRYSTGATLSNLSLLRTWRLFHHEAFSHESPPLPVLPITVRKLVMIGALFKVGGYRSYTNYASIIRSQHLEEGHLWCPLLAHTSGWVTRSVLRGIGPERQSCAFDTKRLFALERPPNPLVSMGPSNPVHMAILATLFLLREVEITTACISAWTFDPAAKEITWLLPGSKSDHMALGVKRTLPCFCGLGCFACAYHVALDHLSWLKHSGHSLAPESPLFPAHNGATASKRSAVLTFEKLGLQCEQPLMSDHGLRLFGGHTPRVTGAQLYAVAGLEINKIRILARHQGDTIMRYVKDAPLASIGKDLGLASRINQVAASGSTDPRVAKHKLRIVALEAKVAGLATIIERHSAELGHLTAAARAAPTGDLIQNTTTSKVHMASTTDIGRARGCGWQFDGATFRARRRVQAKSYRILTTLEGIPGDMICERCLPEEMASAFARDLVHEPLSGDEHQIDE